MSYIFSFSNLEVETGIPGNTLRRYSKRFSFFLPSKTVNRVRKFSQDSIPIFKRIQELYNLGLRSEDVSNKLHEEFSPTVDLETQNFQKYASSEELISLLIKNLQVTLEKQQKLLPDLTSQKDILRRLEKIEKRIDKLESKKSLWAKIRGK